MVATHVLVWGDGERDFDGLQATLSGDGIEVIRADGAPPWDDGVDCIVTPPSAEGVAAVRAEHDVPIVAFGDADGDAVSAVIGAGATDVVQATGSESTAALRERIADAIRGDGTGGGTDGNGMAEDGANGRDDSGGNWDGPLRDRRERRHPGKEGDAMAFAGGEGDADGDVGLQRYAEILEAVDDGVYALDRNGRCVYVNGGMTALSGYSEAELLGSDPGLLLDTRATARIERKIANQWRETERSSVDVTVGTTIECKDGERVSCELVLTALADDDGEFRGTVGVLRDVSGRERRQELLTRLQETSRSLMQAPSRETVARIVVDAARQTLGFDVSVFRLYDPDAQTLVPVASTDATREVLTERPVYDLGEGPAGEVFVSGEAAIYDDVQAYDDDHDRSPVRSVMYFPIGVHGVLSIGTTEAAAFDDVDEQIATLLATNAAAAANRAKREREVRDARERIATILERINGLVEDTIEVLVQATTREEVERGVCEQLAAADPYVFAWIARPDVREERLTASESAGSAAIDVDRVELATNADDPGAGDPTAEADDLPAADGPLVEAYEADESRVLDADGLVAAAEGEPWLAAAREAGVESLMAVPLSYRDGSYGVLAVCSDHADAFDDREQIVIEALGRAVANAINTVESGRILEADTVVELSIAVGGGELLLGRLSADTGADLASAGTMTQDDGALRLFLTATGADGEGVGDALAADDAVEEWSLVAEHDGESLFDVSARIPLIAALVDHGAVPKAIEAEGGVARLTVELPTETAARDAFSIVEDSHPGAELVGYHERERPVRTQQEFRAALSDRFTDRQETALRTAYLGGFFDSPRGVDGEELADGMDISRPTYHQHLRAAQRKVFEELFEADAPGA